MRKFEHKWIRRLSKIFWSSSVEIALSTKEITARLHQGNKAEPETLTRTFLISQNPQEGAFYSQIHEFLSELFLNPNWQNKGVNFILGADVVRYFSVLPFKKTRSLGDCINAAKYRFQQIYGVEDITNWEIQGAWSPDHAFIACAVHKKLLLAINSHPKNDVFRVDSVQPHFNLVWNRVFSQLSAKQWLIINERHHLIIGIIDPNGLAAIRVVQSKNCEQFAPQNLDSIINREALTLNIPIPESLLLVGKRESHWNEELEIAINRWENKTRVPSQNATFSSLLVECNK